MAILQREQDEELSLKEGSDKLTEEAAPAAPAQANAAIAKRAQEARALRAQKEQESQQEREQARQQEEEQKAKSAETKEAPKADKLERVYVSSTLRKDRQLTDAEACDIRTAEATRMTVSASKDDLRLTFAPGLNLNAGLVGDDAAVESLCMDLKTGKVSVGLDANGSSNEWLDARANAGHTLAKNLESAMAGTAFGDGGYDPVTDPNAVDNLRGLADHLATSMTAIEAGASEDKSEEKPKELEEFTAGTSLTLKSALEYGDFGGNVKIPNATRVTIGAHGSGKDLGELSISARPGIEVHMEGMPVALIQEVVLRSGGGIDVRRFATQGRRGQDTGEGLSDVAEHSAEKQSSGPGFESATQSFIERELERNLASAFRELLDRNSALLPGLDLSTLLADK